MKIVLLSACVSLITLIVLLFNRTVPIEIKIPSFFLGGRHVTVPRRLAITKPPWLLWLCVILATVGAAIAYWPPNREGQSGVQAATALLWVDDTLSALVANAKHAVPPSELAKQIVRTGVTLHALEIQPTLATGEQPRRYLITTLTNEQAIATFIASKLAGPPSAFVRPLDTEVLSRQLAQDQRFSNGKAVLMAVTDGQRATMQNLAALRSSFLSVKLFLLGQPDSLMGSREEIVPTDVVDAWSSNQQRRIFTTPFVLENSVGGIVPQFARPGLVRETFAVSSAPATSVEPIENNSEKVKTDPSEQRLAIITRVINNNRFVSTVTACRGEMPGPIELDPLGDLRTLGQFIGVQFRSEECTEATANDTSISTAAWKYRAPTVWIVPLGEEVLQRLATGRVWIPRGFMRGSDIIVFTASLSAQDSLNSTQFIQLDPGAAPVALFLAPPPPTAQRTLLAPATSGNAGSESDQGALIETTLMPALVAADGTELAFAAKNAPVFYLRTTLAMPSNELTRSSSWNNFWLQVLTSASNNANNNTSGQDGRTESGFRRHLLADYSQFGADQEKSFAKMSLFLSPTTLDFVESGFAKLGLRAGLYLAPDTLELALVEIPAEERLTEVVLSEEFERLWNGQEAEISDRDKVEHERRAIPLLGAMLALVALLVLWNFRRQLSSVGVLLLATCFWHPQEARAQIIFRGSSAPANNVPFAISWCQATVPPAVADRYLQLRFALSNRGTIRMPERLLANACRSGGAEVWWTDNPSDINPEQALAHLSGGGFVMVEGFGGQTLPSALAALGNKTLGLLWEPPAKRGMFLRSFYLLHSFDGCGDSSSFVLRLRKKLNAQSPMALVTSVRFLSPGSDCFSGNDEYRLRSFVNLMYAMLTTDYKEDHMQLPELLSRVRNLGLEP